MRKFYTLICISIFFTAEAQTVDFSGEINTLGLISSSDNLPFWLYSNQRGRVDRETNFSGWITSSATYSLSEYSFLKAGLGILYYDGFNDEVKLDESYLEYQNKLFDTYIGRKQRKEFYNGLSATNENILWSLNARPLPGFHISTNAPVVFWRDIGLGFEAELEEFWMGNERFVEGARLHHKSFHFVFRPSENFQFKFGMQHFVQWAGNSPEQGELPGGLNDYIWVFTGKGGGEEATEGEQLNALGNHLGSYEFYFTTFIEGHKLELIYNHLFEDGSGSRFRNTPDGRYGVFFENKNSDKTVSSLMYELFYTRNQSRNSSTTDGRDNYFQNQVYKSGWTYEGFILGVPFIIPGENGVGILNNDILVHHIGIGGELLNKIPYKLLTSYRKNYGAKGVARHNITVWSSKLNLQLYDDLFRLNVIFGSDVMSNASPVFGAGVKLQKQLF